MENITNNTAATDMGRLSLLHSSLFFTHTLLIFLMPALILSCTHTVPGDAEPPERHTDIPILFRAQDRSEGLVADIFIYDDDRQGRLDTYQRCLIGEDGKVIASGWHRAYGGLHAEREALSVCSEDPAGATMYVTLEPCCHYGKQPPCTSAIIDAGISRVVVAMEDPNPLVGGKGASILREHGIEVETGLMEQESRYLNRIFIRFITEHRPWTVLKCAMTLDGKIASSAGDSRWVSCEASRHLVHELRGRHMGIMAGIGTVLADNPMLNCRIDGLRQPVRIIVDSHASLPEDSAIVASAGQYRTVLAHTSGVQSEKMESLCRHGVESLECATGSDGMVDMGDLLSGLGRMGISSVLVEGGAEINWSLIKNGLADEYYFFLAPKIIGGRAAKGPVGGNGFEKMADAAGVSIESVSRCGADWLVHAFKDRALCLQE